MQMLPATDTRRVQAACSPRQVQVLSLAARGMTYQQIGLALGIARRTAENYVARAKKKTGIPTREQLIIHLFVCGAITWTTPESSNTP